jgi:hypothetical protein
MEVQRIRATVDSLKAIDAVTQTIENIETSGDLNNWYIVSKDSVSGKLFSCSQSAPATFFSGYFGNDGKVSFIEISRWQKTTQYLEQYFLKNNTPFYFRQIVISNGDSTLQEAGEVTSTPDWSFRIVNSDEIQKMIEINSLSPTIQGNWFQVKKVSGDKPYELTRLCGEEPFNITVREKSISVNSSQMALVYTVLSTTHDEYQLNITAIDSLNSSNDQVEIVLRQSEPGVILITLSGESRIMIHENYLHLATIINIAEGCDEL